MLTKAERARYARLVSAPDPQTAVRNGDVTSVRAWLDDGGDPNEGLGNESIPPLALACAAGAEEVIQLLLERGAEVSAEALRRVAGFVEPDGVRALLALRDEWDPAVVQAAFLAAARFHRGACAELLAEHVGAWDFAVADGLSPAASMALEGYWFALERMPECDELLSAPLHPSVVERLRTSNLKLRDEANGVDLALAKLRALERYVTSTKRSQGYVDERSLDHLRCLRETKKRLPKLAPGAWAASQGEAGSESGGAAGDADEGDRVVILRGRKSVGAQGTVFWKGKSKHGPGTRLGVRTDDGQKVFVGLDDVDVVEE